MRRYCETAQASRHGRGYASAGAASDLALVLLLGVLWGMTYALNRIALATIPPLTLVAARVSLAAVALWLVVWVGRPQVPQRPALVLLVLVQGGLACLIPYTLIALGQRSVDSALAAILNSCTPLFVCLIDYAWLRKRLRGGQWFGAMLGFGGVVMVAGVGALGGLAHTMTGQFAILAATLSSAVGVVWARRLDGIAPELAAAGILTSAALVLVPLCFLIEAPLHVAPSPASLGALAVNALAATALGFVIYFRLVRTVGSVGTASVGYLKPATGVLIGWTLMAEKITWEMGLGLAAILFGVAAINGLGAGALRAMVRWRQDGHGGAVHDKPILSRLTERPIA